MQGPGPASHQGDRGGDNWQIASARHLFLMRMFRGGLQHTPGLLQSSEDREVRCRQGFRVEIFVECVRPTLTFAGLSRARSEITLLSAFLGTYLSRLFIYVGPHLSRPSSPFNKDTEPPYTGICSFCRFDRGGAGLRHGGSGSLDGHRRRRCGKGAL